MRRISTLSAFAAASALFAAGLAHAGPILTVHSGDLTSLKSVESNFLASLGGAVITETFEGFPVGTQEKVLGTSVGTFEQVTPGSGGACVGNLKGCNGGVAILNTGTSPFSGRFNTTDPGSKWLDSFDSEVVLFTPIAGVNALGFFVTDPNDVNGKFGITLSDGSVYSHIFGIESDPNRKLGNGSVFYVTITSSHAITGVTFLANSPTGNDGYGIDNVSARVPEPGTLALLGLGLLGVGLMRRRG
jgi:hypothetical protein